MSSEDVSIGLCACTRSPIFKQKVDCSQSTEAKENFNITLLYAVQSWMSNLFLIRVHKHTCFKYTSKDTDPIRGTKENWETKTTCNTHTNRSTNAVIKRTLETIVAISRVNWISVKVIYFLRNWLINQSILLSFQPVGVVPCFHICISLNVTVIVVSCLMIASWEALNSELQINVFELVRLQSSIFYVNKYIFFVLFFCLLLHHLAVRISLPIYDFLQVIIVLIQVYNWEIRHWLIGLLLWTC